MANDHNSRDLAKWQAAYLAGAAALLPAAPFLYLLGQRARRKVGLLPDAAGDTTGVSGSGDGSPARLLVIGESTVAGLGASSHDLALAGRFAAGLSSRLRRPVEWTVVGRSGVTARRTINELIPLIPPGREFDHILIGIGGNDVMRISSPKKWRADMLELIAILRRDNPAAKIFISNCPMIKYSPAIPEPIKSILWQLSRMHDANIRQFSRTLDRVYYYPQPADVTLEGFFADGIHPSEQGYADWANAMLVYFDKVQEW